MPVTRLNHAVLYVRDVARSVDFYRSALDFRVVTTIAGGKAAFLQAPGSTNDHDLGLFEVGAQAGPSGAGRATVGLYHLAWEVDTLAELDGVLAADPALDGDPVERRCARRRCSRSRTRDSSQCCSARTRSPVGASCAKTSRSRQYRSSRLAGQTSRQVCTT